MDDTISRQWLMECVEEGWIKFDTQEDENRFVHLIRDIAPSAQQEQTDCGYCHEDSDGYVKPIEKNCHAFIRFGMNGWEISLSAKGWNGSAKIMYCPMCGRRLNK